MCCVYYYVIISLFVQDTSTPNVRTSSGRFECAANLGNNVSVYVWFGCSVRIMVQV